MGLTERHWFENEDVPEKYEWALEDAVLKEPLQPVWKSECMNTKIDMVEVVRCKDCKYCEYPEAEKEMCKKGHIHRNAETWFCADGEMQKKEAKT